MATLQEVLGNRIAMDGHLRERFAREYDKMIGEQQRASYIHLARINHEISYLLQLAREGETTFRNDQGLLKHIQALAWSTDGVGAEPIYDGANLTPREMAEVQNLVEIDDLADRKHEETDVRTVRYSFTIDFAEGVDRHPMDRLPAGERDAIRNGILNTNASVVQRAADRIQALLQNDEALGHILMGHDIGLVMGLSH
jgi:hypothetical protein